MCIQSCLPLCYPRDCSLSSSSVHEIFPGKHTGVGCHFLHQGIFPTWGSFQTRDQNFISCVSCIDRWVFVLFFIFFFFFLITEPPRKPRTTIWSSNSTPGHLSREKHNSNRHMWNLKKAMVCCAVVNWVDEGHVVQESRGWGVLPAVSSTEVHECTGWLLLLCCVFIGQLLGSHNEANKNFKLKIS